MMLMNELFEELNLCDCSVSREGGGWCMNLSWWLCKKRELTWLLELKPVLSIGDNYLEEIPWTNVVYMNDGHTDDEAAPVAAL